MKTRKQEHKEFAPAAFFLFLLGCASIGLSLGSVGASLSTFLFVVVIDHMVEGWIYLLKSDPNEDAKGRSQ